MTSPGPMNRCRAIWRWAFAASCLVVCVCSLAACAHVVSEAARERVDRSLSTEMLFADPDAHRGTTVLIGGAIVGVRNTKEGSFLEVIEHALDGRGRPRYTDVSLGRFLLLSEEYLDPGIYAEGRPVTAVGEVIGKTVRPLDEIDYSYPLIRTEELHVIDRGGRFPVGISIGVGATF